jgi:hypothetical protein
MISRDDQMMRLAIWLTIVLFTFGASASTARAPKAMKRKPTSEAYEMRVSVVFGDRTTQFFVTSSGNDGLLKISNEKGREGKKRLNRSEIELLLLTYAKLPTGNNIPNTCYGSRMDIVMVRSREPQQVKASCFGVDSSTEVAFRHFANLLAQPF